jgi:hypothetical protein
MGNLDAAEQAYRTVLGGVRPAGGARLEQARLEVRGRALQALALLLKRRRRHEDAAAVWERLAAEVPEQAVVALVELAKYWEHRRRDPRRARDYASLAHERWLATIPAADPSRRRALPGMRPWESSAPAARAPDDFSRRLARLEQKQSRATG